MKCGITVAWLSGAALLATTAPSRGVQAAEAGIQRVAVVRVDVTGGVPEAGQELFGQRLAEGLAVARFEVLSTAAVQRRLRELGRPGCNEASCYPDMASALGVGYLVGAHVAEQSKNYDIRLELINGRTGAEIASNHERCETCGIEEAAEKMNLAASALRARLEAVARTPARFVIRTRPAAAYARIDGKSVGRTPLDMEIPAGEHQLTLELSDHDALTRTLTVVSGVDETLDLDLVKQPTTFPYRTFGWSALGVGAAAIIGGIYALAINGNEIACSSGEKDPMGHCPYIRKGDVLGAVLIGVGAVSASLGGVSLFMATRGVETASDDRRPAGVGVAFSGRF